MEVSDTPTPSRESSGGSATRSYHGDHRDPEFPTWLVECDSMHLDNDPRFFEGNVLDKRLHAFASLTIVCSLMVGTALLQCFTMKKNMDLSTPAGWIQIVGFASMSLVLFLDLYTLFILVHQLFYTYRLMTAGPTGFEIAASFYLNPSITQYRHFAIHGLLRSMPLFLFGSGAKIALLCWTDAVKTPSVPEPGVLPNLDHQVHTILAVVVFSCWTAMSLVMHHTHKRHRAIFRERYALVKEREQPLLNHTQRLCKRPSSSLLET